MTPKNSRVDWTVGLALAVSLFVLAPDALAQEFTLRRGKN